MKQCKLCGVKISNEDEYCQNCLQDNKTKLDESYLDNLLKSVVNSQNDNLNITKEKVIKKNNTNNIQLNSSVNSMDEKIMRQDVNNLSDNNIDDKKDDNVDDILALLESYSEVDTSENELKLEDSEKNDYIIKDSDLWDSDLQDSDLQDSNLQDSELTDTFLTDNDISVDNFDDDLVESDLNNGDISSKGLDDNGSTIPNNDMNDADEDLMALLGMISEEENNTIGNEEIFALDESEDSLLDNSNNYQDELNENELNENDVFAIDELFGDDSTDLNEKPNNITDSPKGSNDVGKIFADVLSAVDSLEDEDYEIDEDFLKLLDIPEQVSDKPEVRKDDKKKSFFQKLFGKSDSKKKEKEAIDEIDKNTKNADDEKSIDSAKPKEKVDKKKSKVKKVKESNNKTKKSKKNIEDATTTDGEEQDSDVNTSKKKVKTKVSKKEKKEKKASKAAIQIIEDIEDIQEYSGKINKFVATFIMTVFGVIALVVIVGTNMYSYSLGIKNATANFDMQRYNQAYNEVYGLDIKDKDLEIYDKIMTVMFVNKQLNSFNNYYAIKKYPEALDSLLKGLERYDKYIDLATGLGIESDLDYVRSQIIGELNSKFNIEEKDAMALINNVDQAQYSLNVLNAVVGKTE